MTTYTIGRWLLVALAILGLALAAPAVSAHGDEPTVDDHPDDATADEWAAWMEAHMTDHMGADGVAWMESHMGVTVEEMAQFVADDDDRGAYGPGSGYGHAGGC
jgi:hypothetical protein